MSEKAFRTEFDSKRQLTTVTLAKPESGNKLTGADIAEIAAAIAAAGADPRNKLVVLRAEGEHFCLGRIPDPKPETRPSALELRHGVATTIMALYAAVRHSYVPVLCVVQGEARGFGCAVTAQCDITIAADHARFSLPELDSTIPPTLAMSALMRKVPPKTIAHMVYSRQALSANDARQFGLLSQVVPAAGLDDAVDTLIASLIDKPREALATVKEYLWSALYVDQSASAHLAQNMISVAMSSF